MRYVNALLEYPLEIPENHVYMFTGNQIVTDAGELVMGAGNALAFRQAYPDTPAIFGEAVTELSAIKHPRNIHVIGAGENSNNKRVMKWMVLFTKQHYKDPSELDFVLDGLEQFTLAAKHHPECTFHLPYPAIGFGGLKREDLDKYVELLPDNVIVYVV